MTRSFITAAIAAVISIAGAAALVPAPREGPVFANANGWLRVAGMEDADLDNPFFQPLGTNGRRCVTCHRPAQGWSVTPAELRARFARSNGLEPIFRSNDGSTCGGADVSTLPARRRAFGLLLDKGLIRIALDVPAGAEFDVVSVDDPYRCGGGTLSVYRRPLPAANVKFLSAVMWDGRESKPGLAIRDALIAQAVTAVTSHAQGAPPAAAAVHAIVDFELGLFAAQAVDRAAGSLADGGARSGPVGLAVEPFCLGINDPLDMRPEMPGTCGASSGGLNPFVFRLFRPWMTSPSPERQAIARGEAIFNTRRFVIDEVPGLNGRLGDPLRRPIESGTCTVCHDTPGAGNHSVPMALDIGVANESRRAADLPLYTLRRRATGEIVRTTDPGRALVTGKWDDIGKFKGPVLRGLAARPPYFHDGSAATLADVIEFYDARFQIRFTAREKADLLAFLRAL